MNGTDIQTSKNVKNIKTEFDVHPLLKKRWSPRSFDQKMISEESLMELFEGASLAASAFNEQPWKYAFAFRGSKAFNALHSCLSAGNQPWTSEASVLMVSIARKVFTRNGKYNAWSEHDLGMANSQLMLQAASKNIYGHFMAGFNKEKVIKLLKLSEDDAPICAIALGYLGAPEALNEPYRTREMSPRTRKKVSEFTIKVPDNVKY